MADEQSWRQARREFIRTHHPDRGGDPAAFAANIADVNDGTSGITSASAQVLSSAQSLAKDGHRLSAEMEKLLTAVYAA